MTVNSISQKEFEKKYQIGKSAFERGRYRISIDNLQQAYELVSPYSRLGGEVKMWLVNAYQAIGEEQQSIALCQELISHPHGETKRQAQQLLYIIQAPKLKRPKEWMTEIPDLNSISDNTAKYRPVINNKQKLKPKRQIELVDLSKVNNQDNLFIWLTLLVSCLVFLGLFVIEF